MRRGQLRSRITILRRTEGAQNDAGEPAMTWASLGERFAKVEALRGFERGALQQTWAEVSYRITLDFDPTVTIRRADAIVRGAWDGLALPTLDILDVADPDDRRRTLVLYAREYPQ